MPKPIVLDLTHPSQTRTARAEAVPKTKPEESHGDG